MTDAARAATGGRVAAYRPLPNVPDEMVGPDGIRPAWADLAATFDAAGAADLDGRIARGTRYLRDAGVFLRPYGDPGAPLRDWPLSALPIVLGEAEWRGLEQGLGQRADVLEAVVADLYGPNRLVADGLLPAALVAGSPEWLRPLVGTVPASGHFLHFLAFDLGRGPDGRWWVLGDRAQAPSGAGFALENRIATSRIFPESFAHGRIHRLAGFFRALRDSLVGAGPGTGGVAGILTPGPATDTYHEHAWLARYLGLTLLEGGDLALEGEALHVRTTDGLARVTALLRRVDGIWTDPLELDPGSRLGTPGLLSAVRAGSVTILNGLGSGVIEAPALMAFLPGIARAMTGTGLALPGIATWWMGDARARAYVAERAGRITVGSAHAPGLAFTEAAAAPTDAPDAGLVAQERVTLSTTPVLLDDRLEPRPMTLRLFLLRTPEGWRAMPGGFARIGASKDTTAMALGSGSAVADVWVVADRPVEAQTLLARPHTFRRPEPGPLPTRAADNLYWLGRYVERTETILRLLRASFGRAAEGETGAVPALLAAHLEGYDTAPLALRAAIHSAGQIRDRFSPDGWAVLCDIAAGVAGVGGAPAEAARAAGAQLRALAGFAGLVHENMVRGPGWRFLALGRAIERAGATAGLLARTADASAPDGALDLAVEIGDSVMTHRRRHALTTDRDGVVDLLALDAENPRAIRFQLAAIARHTHRLAEHAAAPEVTRAVLGLEAELEVASPAALDTAALHRLGHGLAALSDRLSERWLR